MPDVPEVHHMCRRLHRDIEIHIETETFITKKTSVFAIGSCFATEIRIWLKNNGYNVLPVNGRTKSQGEEPLTWYNTYSMRDEFRMAENGRDKECWQLWHIKRKGEMVWQDPFRRGQFAKTEDDMKSLCIEHDERIINGIRSAQLIIITLGLIECWKTPDTHRVICCWPGYLKGGGGRCRFHLANYFDNYRNVHEMLTILATINPNARVIITVSPVQLGRTFRTCDQVVANSESKSTLRAVAGAIQRDFGDSVIYFPSYELATAARDRRQAFATDGRHVNERMVAEIMDAFAEAYVL